MCISTTCAQHAPTCEPHQGKGPPPPPFVQLATNVKDEELKLRIVLGPVHGLRTYMIQYGSSMLIYTLFFEGGREECEQSHNKGMNRRHMEGSRADCIEPYLQFLNQRLPVEQALLSDQHDELEYKFVSAMGSTYACHAESIQE